ncbi:hypothetical protein LO763_08615 [Glycomyces sp. A-F 0318]|uniref:hypothetical protein n=1 Tax=Glycomyces amatae TaxID=2881355 RepID=UPI001E4070B7|nr:hypothetical protein [Glycomyces amatae]MCD0443684.1 hypothetical protein [Glycomyces amatae]
MSGDLESLLRSEMADRARAAPLTDDDPGLAELAIAGAGRIRRRRRQAAAASGAGLLVLGAAVFVWQPWVGSGPEGDLIASDTSATEAQLELDMEFVVLAENGEYEVLNEAGESVPISEEQPASVYRLADAYATETETAVSFTPLDGAAPLVYEKPTPETYIEANTGGTQLAVVSPTAEYTREEYQLLNAPFDELGEAPAVFTTDYALTLQDWSDSTAFFSGDLHSTTGGNEGPYWFEEEYDWGFTTVGTAGFEALVVVDITDPDFVCVADLAPGTGLAAPGEQCGSIGSDAIQQELARAAADGEAVERARSAVEQVDRSYRYPLVEGFDLGEYEDRYEDSTGLWTDPMLRWQLTGDSTDDTWLLLDDSGEEPFLSELTPPPGAIMPVLSYVLSGMPRHG